MNVSTPNLSNPWDFVALFLSMALLEKIIHYTNLYESQKAIGKDKVWKNIIVAELLKYIATLIYMGILCLPRRRDYWRRCSDLWVVPCVSKVITRSRWEELTSHIHLVDNEELRANKDSHDKS